MSALDAARAAFAAGFRGEALTTIVAIAGAESGYNPGAHNPTPPDDSYGLWQINYFGNLRAGRTQSYGAPESMYDPFANARAAYDLSGGGGHFTDWTTYTSGAYRSHLAEARDAVASLGTDPGSGGGGTTVGLPSPGDVVSGITGIVDQFNPFNIASDFVTDLGRDITQGLFRLAVFATLLAAGGTLLALGAWRSVSPQTRETLTTAAASAGKAAAV